MDNQEFFKTGDLAQYNSNGELVYNGRIDFQININDKRVETDEIQRTIINYSSNLISDCLVIKLPQDNNLLVAYIIANNSQIDTESIRNYCKDYLPNYMIPSYFILIDKFPLNANGKVDRKQLPLSLLSNNGTVSKGNL